MINKILLPAASIIKFFIFFILLSDSIALENDSKYYSGEAGTLSLMYHRFNENKYPSTNVRMEIFEKQIQIIKNKKYKFENPDDFQKNFEKPKDEKKIFHLGVSNFAAWQIMKAQYISKINHFPLIEFLQPMYNLVKRQVEVEILPMAHSENLNVISYSPLGGGLLTGKYDQDFRETQKNEIGRLDHNEKYQKRYGQNWMNKVVKDFIKLSKELNYNPISLAVAWVIYNQDILSPIISARNLKQLIPSLDSMKISITKEIYESINKITRTPPPATDRLEDVES